MNIMDIKYLIKYSSELNDNEIYNFINVINDVFGDNFNVSFFEWKYINNIYGDSIIVIAYLNGEAIGTRSFWRNDIDGNKAYQPGDTAVRSEFRGLGIFYEMTRKALELAGDSIIYNFPNLNSLHGDIKLGWQEVIQYNLHLYDKNAWEVVPMLTQIDYIKWRFVDNPIKKYYYFNINNRYYLLTKKKFNIYIIVCAVEKDVALLFKKLIFPVVFYYSSYKNIFKVLNNKSRLVSKNDNSKIVNTSVYVCKGDML